MCCNLVTLVDNWVIWIVALVCVLYSIQVMPLNLLSCMEYKELVCNWVRPLYYLH
jgi:hypothetical protein